MEEGVPYIGFSNEQLDAAPEVGNTYPCLECGIEIGVESVTSKEGLMTMQFITHCGTTWLVGIEGKEIFWTKPDRSGRVDLDLSLYRDKPTGQG